MSNDTVWWSANITIKDIDDSIKRNFAYLKFTEKDSYELARFFFAKIKENDLERCELSPGPVLDPLWHKMLLNPKDYYNFSNEVAGEIIDHKSENSMAMHSNPRYIPTRKLMIARYGAEGSQYFGSVCYWPEYSQSNSRGFEGLFNVPLSRTRGVNARYDVHSGRFIDIDDENEEDGGFC